jgi:hypothetical protein
MTKLGVAISEHIASRTGLQISVEMHDHTAKLRGCIPAVEARAMLLHLAGEPMPRWTLIDELEVEHIRPRRAGRACKWESEWLDVVG